MDFDDLILTVIQALRDVPEFQDRCRQRFRQVLVTSSRTPTDPARPDPAARRAHLRQRHGRRRRQAVDLRLARRRDREHPQPVSGHRLPLTVNRRSVQEILDAATALSAGPRFLGRAGPGGRPRARRRGGPGGDGGRLRARGEARRRRDLPPDRGRPPPRADRGARPLGEAAAARVRGGAASPRHPVRHDRRLRFFDREEVKDVLALVRLVADPMDDGALTRLLQGPIVRLGRRPGLLLARRRIGRYGMRLRDCLDEARAEGWPS